MNAYSYKQITDPVHTTIGLSELETRIISTPAFQRLRSVRQLGLAHLVFPGADYSRFAHSLGVCHVTGLILNALRASSGFVISEHDFQKYRLAGLLHDVGHYPFSHAMEDAVADYYSADLLEDPEELAAEDNPSPNATPVREPAPQATPPVGRRFIKHERVGEEVLSSSEEIASLLTGAGFEPSEISSIFLREDPNQLKNLISSDFDADRIDYLMRTAKHSGLPYGSIDLPYLLTQIRLHEPTHTICITRKGIRAADHFLLSRYFDYSQVAYHKTVASLELILKDALADLLGAGHLRCSREDVVSRIRDGTWAEFTDDHVFRLIEQRAAERPNDVEGIRAQALVRRRPPKLVWEGEWLLEGESGAELKKLRLRLIRTQRRSWAERFDLPEEFWKEWSVGSKLTKIGSLVPPSLLAGAGVEERDRYEQAIRVLQANGETVDIMNDTASLMYVLSRHEMLKIRVYVLLPQSHEARLPDIRAAVARDLDG